MIPCNVRRRDGVQVDLTREADGAPGLHIDRRFTQETSLRSWKEKERNRNDNSYFSGGNNLRTDSFYNTFKLLLMLHFAGHTVEHVCYVSNSDSNS